MVILRICSKVILCTKPVWYLTTGIYLIKENLILVFNNVPQKCKQWYKITYNFVVRFLVLFQTLIVINGTLFERKFYIEMQNANISYFWYM